MPKTYDQEPAKPMPKDHEKVYEKERKKTPKKAEGQKKRASCLKRDAKGRFVKE